MTLKERNAKIIKAIKAYTKKHTATKEAAHAALYREGFIYKDGGLRPEYGGKKPNRRSRTLETQRPSEGQEQGQPHP